MQYLGPLALGTRLKQVSDLLYSHVEKVYEDLGIALSPRFFPLFFALTQESEIGITTLAKKLRTNHPAVSQMVSELIKQELVISETSKKDVRCTLVRLSSKGSKLAETLRPIWDDIEKSIRELLDQTGMDLLDSLNRLEHLLQEQQLVTLVRKRQATRNGQIQTPLGVVLEPWTPGSYEHLYFFERLTVEWLSEYGFKVEAVDTKVFEDPEAAIIKTGGAIFFVRSQGTIVGVAALIRKDASTYELARMAVTKSWRRKGIGEFLASAAIQEARTKGATEVFLETHTSLTKGFSLYGKLGFTIDSKKKPRYARANQVMRLSIR